MKSVGWGATSGTKDLRAGHAHADEAVSGFVVSCLQAAHSAYPETIDTASISGETAARKTGEQMLQALCEAGLLIGGLAQLRYTSSGHASFQRASQSDPVIAAHLEGDATVAPSIFVLALLKEHAARQFDP